MLFEQFLQEDGDELYVHSVQQSCEAVAPTLLRLDGLIRTASMWSLWLLLSQKNVHGAPTLPTEKTFVVFLKRLLLAILRQKKPPLFVFLQRTRITFL